VGAAIPVIVNAKSGPGNRADATAIAAAFAARGLQAQVRLVEGDGIADAVKAALADGADRVVVGGGDGTLATAAAELLDRDVAFGILPLGTLNHFARTLRLPPDLDDAVGVIAAGRTAQVDVGQAADRVFLNNASLGLYPTIVDERDRVRRRLHMGKWPALARATVEALRDPETFTTVVRLPDAELRRRTPFLFVGNNRYALEGLRMGRRARVDEGVLQVCVMRPKSALGFAWLALRALFGWTSARDFEAFETTGMDVEAGDGTLQLASDGEVGDAAAPVRFRILPRALRVFVPESAAATG